MGSLKTVSSQDASLRVQRPATAAKAEPDLTVIQLRAAQVFGDLSNHHGKVVDRSIVEIMFSVCLGEIKHDDFSSKIVASCIPAPKIQDTGCA